MSVIRNQHKWEAIRQHIIRRDFGTCQICGDTGTDVDHKTERRDGGTDDYDNLWLLCNPCHKAKTKRRTQQQPNKPFFGQQQHHTDSSPCFLSPTSLRALDGPFRAL